MSLEVYVTPSVDGSATLEIDRFDPVFGWQFSSQHRRFARVLAAGPLQQ